MASKPHFDGETDANALQKDESTGTYTFTPRAFNIVWGNDPRYWRIPAKGTSDPAELVQVSWLEVTGSVDLTIIGKYEISFTVSLKQDAFGWSGYPIFMMAKVGKKGRYSWKRVKPFDPARNDQIVIPEDSKFEIDVLSPDKLYFGLYEVWSGKWKGGLQIHKAVVKRVAAN